MVIVRDGIYLEDNPPVSPQFRVGRRAPVKSVVVVHTAESGTDRSGPDAKAEGTANFIRTRSDPGSYHLLGDSDSIIQLVRFENEAFQDGTGSNRWAIGISLAMNAADWSGLAAARRDEFITSAAQMAFLAARWLADRGLSTPAPVLLTKTQSDAIDASGFISHARRDPARRTDPGADFPWGLFFARYSEILDAGGLGPTRDELIRQLQALVGTTPDGIVGPLTIAALNRNWLGRDSTFDSSVADSFTNNPVVIEWVQGRVNAQGGYSLVVDGQYGPATEQAVSQHLSRSGVVAAESFLTLTEVTATTRAGASEGRP